MYLFSINFIIKSDGRTFYAGINLTFCSELVQFAVADKGPKINEETGAPYIDELYYTGDASLLDERTETFINKTGNCFKR